MSKILVTGGAGFIGSHIVDLLIKNRHRVIVVDNLSHGKRENLNTKATFYKVDILSKNLETIFRKEKPDFVCHQAAHIHLRESVRDPISDAKTNILGSLNLLQNCVKYKVKKVVFASTGGALYGEAKIIPTPETYQARPISPYGVAKLSVEEYLYYYYKVFGLPYIILRYANVYGPRQDACHESGVIAIFILKLLKNEQPIIFGDGRQTRDFVYVTDVAQANLQALQSKKIDFYNVGTGTETSINQIFKKLVKIIDLQIKEKHGQAMPGEQRRSCLSYTKIKRDLGWTPKVKLEEGLYYTVEWFKKNLI